MTHAGTSQTLDIATAYCSSSTRGSGTRFARTLVCAFSGIVSSSLIRSSPPSCISIDDTLTPLRSRVCARP